jgi:hypothetical protein
MGRWGSLGRTIRGCVVQLAEYEVVARMNCAKRSEFFTCFTRFKRVKNEPKLTLILISCKEKILYPQW